MTRLDRDIDIDQNRLSLPVSPLNMQTQLKTRQVIWPKMLEAFRLAV